MKKRKSKVEIREYDGVLDEVVAKGVDVHLEYMGDDLVWMQIGDVVVNLWTKRGAHIKATVERQ